MTDNTQTEALLPSRETLMAQAQVFASAWAIAGSRFDSGDGVEVAEQEKAILADMTRRLHARITELEAARFTYASEFAPTSDGDPDVSSIHANIRALKAQLAQCFVAADMATAAAHGFRDGVASVSAGSEPVARLVIGKTKGGVSLTHMVVPAAYQLQEGMYALYTAPRPVAREPLTPERVKEIVRGAGYDQCGIPDTERAAFINGLRHGEREHGIKGGQHVS